MVFPFVGGSVLYTFLALLARGEKAGVHFFCEWPVLWLCSFPLRGGSVLHAFLALLAREGRSGLAFFLRVVGVMVMFFSAARWMFSAGVQRK